MRFFVLLLFSYVFSFGYLLQDDHTGQFYECEVYDGHDCSLGYDGYSWPDFYVHLGGRGEAPFNACTYGLADRYSQCVTTNGCTPPSIYDPESKSCVDPCEQPQPDPPPGFEFLGEFPEIADCENYMQTYRITNFVCEPKPSGCPGVYGYGDTSDQCDTPPPPTYKGLPYQGYYPSQSWCIDAIRYFSVDGSGECINFPPCSKTFGYFVRPDGSSTDPEPPNDSPPGDTPPDPGSGGDTSGTDDNNDGIDLNPLMDQLDRIAQQNHNDLTAIRGQVSGGFDGVIDELLQIHFQNAVMNSYLSDLLDSGAAGTNVNVNVDMSGVESRLDTINDTLNQEGPELPDSTFIDDFISSVSDQFTSLKDQIYAVEGVMTGDLPAVSLPSGSTPVYSMDYHGQTVSFDLCASFATFKPILTFIFTFVFMILSVRIGWSAIKIAFMGGS